MGNSAISAISAGLQQRYLTDLSTLLNYLPRPAMLLLLRLLAVDAQAFWWGCPRDGSRRQHIPHVPARQLD